MKNWKQNIEELMCKLDTFKNAKYNLIVQKAAENWADKIQKNNFEVQTIVTKNSKADTVKILVFNTSLNMEIKLFLFMAINEDENCYNLVIKHECIIDDIIDENNPATEYIGGLEISNEEFIQNIINEKYIYYLDKVDEIFRFKRN